MLRRTSERDCGRWRETTRNSPAESSKIFSAMPACDGPRMAAARPRKRRSGASAAGGNGGIVHASNGAPGRFADNGGRLATTTTAVPPLCRTNCNSDKEDEQAEKTARTPSTGRPDYAAPVLHGQEKRLDATPRLADAEAGPRELLSRAVKSRGGGFSSCSETLFSCRIAVPPTLITGRPRRHRLPPNHPSQRRQSGLVLIRR